MNTPNLGQWGCGAQSTVLKLPHREAPVVLRGTRAKAVAFEASEYNPGK